MVRASKGIKRRTRRRLRRGVREKFTVGPMVKQFKPDECVIIRPHPSSQHGSPHPKLTGLSGIVVAARGESYAVSTHVGNKKRTVIVRPEHLMRVRRAKTSGADSRKSESVSG